MNKLFMFFIFICSGINAQVNKYSFYREIKNVNENGYYAVPLSPEILAKCRSAFTDFRIYETNPNDTVEAPFMMNWKDEEFKNIEYSATLIDATYKNKIATFVTLKFNEPKEINEIHLEIEQNNFDKLVKLEGSSDNKDWKTIDENMRIVGFGYDNYKYTKLSFGTCTFRYFRITLNDIHAKPITITGATTYYNRYLSGSYTKINGVNVLRTEKKSEAKNYRTAKGRTVQTDAENKTELKIILPAKVCLHHIKLKSKDSLDFYRFATISDAEKNNLNSSIFTSLEKDKFSIIPIEKIVTAELIISIENKDNQPVKDIEVEVYGQNAELICKLDPEKNYLLSYSASNDHKPEYDMEYFADKLPKTKGVVVLGEEKITKEIKPSEPLVKNQKWLWITMGALILLIGGFAFSLMKKANNA